MDVLVDGTCYSLIEEPLNFENAKKQCSEPSNDKADPSLWLPSSKDAINAVVENVGPFSKTWVQKPSVESASENGNLLYFENYSLYESQKLV